MQAQKTVRVISTEDEYAGQPFSSRQTTLRPLLSSHWPPVRTCRQPGGSGRQPIAPHSTCAPGARDLSAPYLLPGDRAELRCRRRRQQNEQTQDRNPAARHGSRHAFFCIFSRSLIGSAAFPWLDMAVSIKMAPVGAWPPSTA